MLMLLPFMKNISSLFSDKIGVRILNKILLSYPLCMTIFLQLLAACKIIFLK